MYECNAAFTGCTHLVCNACILNKEQAMLKPIYVCISFLYVIQEDTLNTIVFHDWIYFGIYDRQNIQPVNNGRSLIGIIVLLCCKYII